ncbi:MAG TPA: hypothetical protein VM490_04120 [Armatimonadaceae bacterium]|nr:hypothetical protein [Armatimonadaceae bacterium]
MGLFTPQAGTTLWLYIAGALLASGVLFLALQLVPGRLRKPLIAAVTFVAGLYYVAEFFLPADPATQANFLTPYRSTIAQINQVLLSLAVGVGVYSLLTLHTKNIARRRQGWGYSVTLLAAMVGIFVTGLLKEYRPNDVNKAAFSLFFDGGLKSLDAAMFSIVAFYIVSAAYRAFRVRSLEATILLASAFLVMIGQVPLGQALTIGLPTEGFLSNFRTENIREWILTRASAPALLAVELGLGLGALSTSIRLWLSLERGSYFEKDL